MLKKFGLAALTAALTAALAGTVAMGAAPAIAADMPKKGGTLVMISSQVPRHFNPAVQSGIATMAPGAHLFATLIRSDANWNFHPYLATSWTTSADGKSVTFKLRTDATFHDGKPITSADVKFSIETQKANHPFKTSLGAVSGVETPDAHTVVVKLKSPHPALLLAMSTSIVPIIPKHVYGDGQNPKTHPRNTTNLVGSGAYILKEYKRAQYILLERNPNYFLKGRPYMDRIIYKIIRDSSSRVIAMERGEGNMMPFMSEVASVVRLKKNDKLIVTDKGYAGIGPITWLAFNTKEGPTKDVRVRRAIAYAIDRKFITQQLHRGVSTAATGPIVPGSPFYTKDVETYEVDLKKAEALLEAAGYPKKADGTRLDLTIDYLPAVPDVQQRIAEYARGAAQEGRHQGHGPQFAGLPDLGPPHRDLAIPDDDGPAVQLGRSGDRRAPLLSVQQRAQGDLVEHPAILQSGGRQASGGRRQGDRPGQAPGALCQVPADSGQGPAGLLDQRAAVSHRLRQESRRSAGRHLGRRFPDGRYLLEEAAEIRRRRR